MKNKVKMISVNEFEKAADSAYKPSETVEWNGLNVVIRKHLTLPDIAKFADICVKSCFDPNTAVYAPEAKDAAIRSCIVAFYTNITLPDNVVKQYELIYHSGILDIVLPNIDRNQLDAVVKSIDEKIDYIAHLNTETVNKQMRDLQNTAAGIQNQMTEMFKGISVEDIRNIMSAMTDKGLDEEKLMKAYMENKEQ